MQPAYLLLPIGIGSIILYLFTLLLSKLSIIKLVTHRKIWNILLLVTFIITAILGLILAVQVNYKLELPYLKQILTYHVDFGIGMSMITVFHFLWHWNYYRKMLIMNKLFLKKEQNKETTNVVQPDTTASLISKKIWIIALLLGFTSMLTQIILLREFLIIFNGNELIIGIILTSWMVLTGIGAMLGRYIKSYYYTIKPLLYAIILIGTIPLMLVYLMNILKNIVFEPGMAVGILKIAMSIIIILLPFCLLTGYLFTYIATLFSVGSGNKNIDKTYAYESIGSIIAGVGFSFLMANTLNTFQVLGIIFFINLVTGSLLLKAKFISKAILVVISSFILVLFFITSIDKKVRQHLFINQDLVYLKDSPYGNISVTTYGDQLNFYENNVLLFSTENVIANEEAVHYAMIQHPKPKNVLLISGGISGITNEILKYDIENLDYVELNPWLFKIGKKYTTTLNNPKIKTIKDDARAFVKKTKSKYDVVIINLPEPLTAQINRYYTIEFYEDLKQILNHNGLITFSLPSTVNYLNDEAIKTNSIIYKTVKSVFNYVLIFPGEKNYFIASDNELELNIIDKFQLRNIDNAYVNQYYLDYFTIEQHSAYILSSIDLSVKINRDFFPVSYLRQIIFWFSQFKSLRIVFYPFLLLVTILLILFFTRAHPVNSGMFTAGYVGSSIEIILLFSFQVVCGYIYQAIGAFFAVFMAGLAMGSFLRKRIITNPVFWHVYIIQGILLVLIFITFPSVFLLKMLSLNNGVVYLVCFVLLFLVSFVVGTFFSLASVIQKEQPKIVAAKIYSSDLVGSAFGALLTSTVLIPLTGIYTTIIITAGLSLFYLAIAFLKRKNGM